MKILGEVGTRGFFCLVQKPIEQRLQRLRLSFPTPWKVTGEL